MAAELRNDSGLASAWVPWPDQRAPVAGLGGHASHPLDSWRLISATFSGKVIVEGPSGTELRADRQDGLAPMLELPTHIRVVGEHLRQSIDRALLGVAGSR